MACWVCVTGGPLAGVGIASHKVLVSVW